LFGGTEENYEDMIGQPVSETKFESRTSQTPNRIVSHLSVTYVNQVQMLVPKKNDRITLNGEMWKKIVVGDITLPPNFPGGTVKPLYP
jgi:hypothetical protein